MIHLSKTISRGITLIGAGIVFTTFVVKDVMRENLKDLNESINAAELYYSTQQSILATQSLLVDVDGGVGVLMTKPAQPPAKSNYEASDDEAEVQEIKNVITTLKSTIAISSAKEDLTFSVNKQYIQNLVFLLKKLPKSDAQSKEAEQLLSTDTTIRDQLKSDKERFGKILDQFQRILDKYGDDDPPEDVESRILKKLATLGNQAEEIKKSSAAAVEDSKKASKRAQALADSVLGNVHEEEERSRHKYERATTASYILYTVGWALGLLGRFFGASGASEGAD